MMVIGANSSTSFGIKLGFLVCLLIIQLACGIPPAEGHSRSHNKGKQTWGYVQVRPGAYMFWWLYYTTGTEDYTKKPLVLWLQGGPGASGTGFGNFGEIGPLDINLNNRSYSWVNYTNVLFVDNPVGTGFSYVNDTKTMLATNNTMIAMDLMEMFSKFLFKVPEFQTVPFYIFSESYGGKMAVQFSQRLYKTIEKGKLKCNFKGLAMGDSWISPVDSVLSWGQYLFSTSLVDNSGLVSITNSANATKTALDKGQFTEATKLFESTQDVISTVTNGVNFYNILQKNDDDGSNLDQGHDQGQQQHPSFTQFTQVINQHKNSLAFKTLKPYHEDKLSTLMNGPIKKKLQIIPVNVTWGGQSGAVFNALGTDFMKPVVVNVESLLNSTPISVNVYTGQLDLIVNTIGTTKWVEALTWPGITSWQKAKRRPIILAAKSTEAFVKSYANFSFYWILKAGHMVPSDAPETGAELLQLITGLKKLPSAA